MGLGCRAVMLPVRVGARFRVGARQLLLRGDDDGVDGFSIVHCCLAAPVNVKPAPADPSSTTLVSHPHCSPNMGLAKFPVPPSFASKSIAPDKATIAFPAPKTRLLPVHNLSWPATYSCMYVYGYTLRATRPLPFFSFTNRSSSASASRFCAVAFPRPRGCGAACSPRLRSGR